MWSAFGEELSLMIAPNWIRIRRFSKWPPRLLFEAEQRISILTEPSASLNEVLEAVISARTKTARAFVSEDLCKLGWTSLPNQMLTDEEIEALIRSQNSKESDVALAFDQEPSANGAIFASVERALLTQLEESLAQLHVRLNSAEPALTAVVQRWLNAKHVKNAKHRRLVVLSERRNYLFAAVNGGLSMVTVLPGSMPSDDLEAQISSVRISSGLTSADLDVLVAPSSRKPAKTDASIARRPAISDFADLYESANSASAISAA